MCSILNTAIQRLEIILNSKHNKAKQLTIHIEFGLQQLLLAVNGGYFTRIG